MKHNVHYLFLVLFALISSTSLNAQSQSSGQIIEDGEAFYIYRNDGDFNGFFYDEVEEMRYSKVDLEGVEHDDYVIQEVVTADSLYRIPLCAIDSIGFVQPEIIVSDICSLSDERSPYFTYEVDFDEEYSYNFHYLKDWMTRKVLEVGDIVQSHWYYKDEQGIRKSHGMLLARVRSIKPDGEFYKSLYGANAEGYYVECDPIESMDEIFKQFITVEKEYSTPDGRQMRRMAGYNQVRRKLSDRRDLTLVDLNGHFYKEFKKDFEGISFTADIGVDINAKATGTVVYNIRGGKYYIKTELSCEAAVGLSANLTGTLNETYTQYFAKDVAFMFPSFLPIFQISPLPGTFVRSSGDITLSLRTPKLGAKASFAVIISDDGISGSPVRFQGDADTIDPSQSDNSWNISASLNGSTQTGIVFPFMIETNSWLRRFLNCSVGAEVFVGPKFSGSFTLDPVSMLSGDVYGTFSNTQIGFTPLDVVVEGSCSARIGTGKDTKMELFKAEMEVGRMQLNLFPQFDQSTFAEGEMTSYTAKEQYAFFPESGIEIGMCISHHTKVKSFNLTIHPKGTAMPCKIYAGVYNKDKERLYTLGVPTHANYSLFNQPGQIEVSNLQLPGNGEFHICPVIGFMGFELPVWSEENVVNYESPITVADAWIDRNTNAHYLAIGGIHQGDIVQMEYVPTAHDGEKWWLYGDGAGYAQTNDYFSYSEMPTYADAMGNTPFNTETDKPFVKLYKFSPRTSPDLLGNDIVRIDSSYRVTVIRGGRTLYTKTFNPTYYKDGSIYFYGI